MRQDIKFAGIMSNWTMDYATKYSRKLEEMGFCAKLLEVVGSFIVAYSPNLFSRIEAAEVLTDFQKEGDGDRNSES